MNRKQFITQLGSLGAVASAALLIGSSKLKASVSSLTENKIRVGNEWYAGALNNSKARSLKFPLIF